MCDKSAKFRGVPALGSSFKQTKSEPQRTAAECVTDALTCGYRFLESAEFYGNESKVGKAIKSSEIARKESFFCNKVCTATIEKGDEAIRSIRACLDQNIV